MSCFPRFYGWSLAHKSVPRTFSGSHSAAVPGEGEREDTEGVGWRRRRKSVEGRRVASDEWMKPAVPEARRTGRVILLARVPTTLSRIHESAGRQAGRQAARAFGCEGEESCFDSRGGSRLVGVMRRIEFIGSALDQAGLRSGIKKGSECFGIGRTPAGLFAGATPRARSRGNDAPLLCAGEREALGYDFPLIIGRYRFGGR